MEGTDMNSMPSLTLTERIAEVCASLISELGEKPLDKDAVSQRCEGVSLSNAQKNLASLMNLGNSRPGETPNCSWHSMGKSFLATRGDEGSNQCFFS